MKKNRLALLLAALFVVSIAALPQKVGAQSAQERKEKYRNPANDPVRRLPYYKKLRWADGLFRDGSFFTAIEYYRELLAEQPRNPYITYQLAECYYFSRDYGPAAQNYQTAYALSSKIYPEAKFKEAAMLKQQGLYDSATKAFNQFIADNPKSFKKLKKTALREIQGCVLGKNSVNQPEAVTVKNAGPNINSAYTELSPYPLGDTALLFSTMSQNSVVSTDGSRSSYYARFMVSHKQYYVPDVDSFQWPLEFKDGDFNDPRAHTGNGCYSPGGDRFYFSRCRVGDSAIVTCKLYVSNFDTLRGRWKSPELLGEGINEDGSNTQPFVAKVGKKEILFFSSNRKIQSRGRYDIWYSVIDPKRGSYRRPQNCGKQINTEGDEVTPYYDYRVGKLYFSSNGQVSMGGFDVFEATGGPSRYTAVRNMGYPINSSADELYYIKDPVGKPDAYVVSNRIGSIALKNPTCCDDIWRIQTEPKLSIIGKVLNAKNQQQMKDVVVKMVDEGGNLRTYTSADGNFQFYTMRGHDYVITGDKASYVSTRAQVSTQDIQRTSADQTVNVTVYLDSISINGSFHVSNVYYAFNSANLEPSSIASLDSLTAFMKDNPSLTVDIFSYCDSVGSDKYNKDLSLRRAKSVLGYLTNAGIPAARMRARGFGERRPAEPNSHNGIDYPVGRQLNRRTEFLIIKEDPTRRIIFKSSEAGTIDSQFKNLQLNEQPDDAEGTDPESGYGEPGSRVNKNQNP